MKTQKILAGTLVAGVALFLLGWLIYGVLLKNLMAENCDNSNMRPMEEMVWWAMIASNLASGLLLAVILNWLGSYTMGSGIKVGAVLGLLTALSFDLSMYAMTTMFSNLTMVVIDSLCFSVMLALAGLLAAWVMGKMSQQNA